MWISYQMQRPNQKHISDELICLAFRPSGAQCL